MKRTRFFSIVTAALFMFLAGLAAPVCRAQEDGDEMPFKDAEFYIEFNASGIDAGVQVFLDGDNWRKVSITDPHDRTIFMVRGRKTLGWLGLTELFFESVEPEIGDLPLAWFLLLFPEGFYEFEGMTKDGMALESEAEFTHAIPCAPEILLPEEGAVVDPGPPVIISWEEVMEIVDPEATDAAGEVVCTEPEDFGYEDFEIETYQVIVESDAGDLVADLVVDEPKDAWELTVPEELIEKGTLYQFEVLAKEGSGNQTITEGFFCTKPLSEADCAALADAP